jgi:hypothetical protein
MSAGSCCRKTGSGRCLTSAAAAAAAAATLCAQVKGKLEKDERWKLLPNDGERRLVFDEFCKNVAAEQKALAAAAEKQAVDGFK